jgi:hypothetical protein
VVVVVVAVAVVPDMVVDDAVAVVAVVVVAVAVAVVVVCGHCPSPGLQACGPLQGLPSSCASCTNT